MWISPSWEIYERWCFVRLGSALRRLRSDLAWERTGSHSAPAWVGEGGGEQLKLLLQPQFPSERPTVGGTFWSVSGQRIPDLVLRIRRAGRESFLVLDAKYRCSRSAVLDAMTSAHVYQDSLRIAGRRPEASLLLIPAGGGAPWLEEREFQVQNRVGAIPFLPGSDAPLPDYLRELIAS